MKGDCNKSLKLLFRRGIEDLYDDEFEGSKEEDSIFREIFFGQENDKTSKKCLVTGAINFENEYKKPKDVSFGCNSDNSVMTSQTDSQNIKESEEFTLSARNDPDVEVKRRKVLSEQEFNTKPYLEKIVNNSSIPLKETDSCLFQPTTIVTCRLVESSAQGFKSSCYLLKGTIAELTASKSRLSSSDTNDQKRADVSAAIASPVSQESYVSKLQCSKRKWKDSSFVELDEDELLRPPENSATDPKALLRCHIHRLFKETTWVIGRRNRTTHCKGHGEFVYKSPSGRTIREFDKAWSMCGQKLVADASYVVGDSNGIQWTSLTEFQSDFNDTLIEIEEQLRNLEPTTALAHWWYLLDPFAKVVFIDKSLKYFKEGKPVNTTRTVVDGFYFSDDAVLPLNNQYDVMQTGGSEIVLAHQDDVMQTNEHEHKKSKKLSEMKLSACYGLQETSEISGQLKSNISESYGSCIKSTFCSSDARHEKKQSPFKKSVHKRGKEKKGNCHVNDDDLLLSALLKNRLTNKSSRSKKKSRVPKGKCRLRPRSLTKHGQQQVEGRRSGLGLRTMLSLLIDFGVINVNEVIQYRNPKDDSVMKDGLITRDGILCRCCEKILSVSEFKNHAGFSLKSPCLNLFMESGKSLTLCQLEAWSTEYKVRRGATRTIEVEDIDENDDSCGLCGDGGELVCCDNCPSTFHLKCLCVEELPEGNWYCSKCSCWICGNVVNDTEASSSGALKCVQCEHKYHEECLREKGMMEREIVPSATWFCGESCEEIHARLQSRIGFMNPMSDGFSCTLLKCIHGDLKVHSAQRLVALKGECNLKLAVALTIMEECFLPMVDPRTGIDMIPHVMYNWGSEFARLNYEGFYTMILEKDDVILCVASVRIHGANVAEMPLIATCNKYRRQGMCRRLMNKIEEMLKSLKVEKLVVSAIPSLVDTWTQGFGFTPLEADEKKTFTKTSLMVFPGTVWLKKPMYQGATQSTPTEGVDYLAEERQAFSKAEGSSFDAGFEVNPILTGNFE